MSDRSSEKKLVVLDPSLRKIDEIFTAHDLARLQELAHVVWARDDAIKLCPHQPVPFGGL